jgi:hypothetical protein
MRAQEKINFRRGIDKQMRRMKKPNMLKAVNQQYSKRNSKEIKQQIVLELKTQRAIK